MLSQGHMGAALFCYTGQVAPRFGDSVHLRSGNDAKRHGWGWYPLQTTSYIHSRHIQSVWDIGMLSQGHMVAPLYRYTGQFFPSFGNSDSLEEWKWCHNLMVKAEIHLRPLHTTILDIFKVFETLVCCLKDIWFHPYTITLAKFPPDLGIQVHLRS